MTIPVSQLSPKDPDDDAKVQIQLGPWLAGVQSPSGAMPTISGITAIALPGDLTIVGSVALDGTNAYVTLSGGTIGTSYTITLQITLSDGQYFERSASIMVLGL